MDGSYCHNMARFSGDLIEDDDPSLTDDAITSALDGLATVTQTGRAGRPHHSACDHMYDKGWDDCLDSVRSWLRLALSQ